MPHGRHRRDRPTGQARHPVYRMRAHPRSQGTTPHCRTRRSARCSPRPVPPRWTRAKRDAHCRSRAADTTVVPKNGRIRLPSCCRSRRWLGCPYRAAGGDRYMLFFPRSAYSSRGKPPVPQPSEDARQALREYAPPATRYALPASAGSPQHDVR